MALNANGGYIANCLSVSVESTGVDHFHNTTDTSGIVERLKGTADLVGNYTFQMTNDGPEPLNLVDISDGSLEPVDNLAARVTFNTPFIIKIYEAGASKHVVTCNIVITHITVSWDTTQGDHILVTHHFGATYSALTTHLDFNGPRWTAGSDAGSFSSIDAKVHLNWEIGV